MKKSILCILLCILTCISVNAKTRYVANHFNKIQITTADTLGNIIPELTREDMSYNSVLCTTFNDLQFYVLNLNVSDEENSSIKRLKALQGWSIAASIMCGVSSVISSAQSISAVSHTHHLYSLVHNIHAYNSLLATNIALYNVANISGSLSKLTTNTGIALSIYNPTNAPKELVVNSVNMTILPHCDFSISLDDNKSAVIGMNMQSHQYTVMEISGKRDVYKLYYEFEYNDKYYCKESKTYFTLGTDNPLDKNIITKEIFKQAEDEYKDYKRKMYYDACQEDSDMDIQESSKYAGDTSSDEHPFNTNDYSHED